jgi:cytochrome c biogenesis protein CcmG, thiol:disulfide interchange protein DsbE
VTSATSKRERKKARRAERLEAERAASRRQQRGRRIRIAIIGVVVVAAVIALAVWMVRGADATLGVPAAEVSGEPLAPFPGAGAPDPAVGSTAPDVTGYDPAGNVVEIGATGQPQALSFLAHWCPHCQDEVPEVVAWIDEGNAPEGVDIVAVSTMHDPARPNWPPDTWLEREGWQGDVLVDHDDSAAEAYGLSGTPYWVFVDADGTVTGRHAGRLSLEGLEEQMQALVDG